MFVFSSLLRRRLPSGLFSVLFSDLTTSQTSLTSLSPTSFFAASNRSGTLSLTTSTLSLCSPSPPISNLSRVPSLQLKSPMKNITCVIALHSLCSGGNRRKARPRALSFNSFSLNGDRARERRKSSIQPTSRTNELVKCLARAAAFPMSPRLSSTVRVCCFDLMTAYVVQRTGATCCHQVGPGSAASSLPLNRG